MDVRIGGESKTLKAIDPLFRESLLTILAEMGHGDELAIVDANFPAVSMGNRVLRMSASAVDTLDAVLKPTLLKSSGDSIQEARSGLVDESAALCPMANQCRRYSCLAPSTVL